MPNVPRTSLIVVNKKTKSLHTSPPAATGNAGPCFEAKVGAYYLLGLVANSEPRGLPGATTERVQFQQAPAGCPMDDVVVQAVGADGLSATLELQAKRTLNFTRSDKEFKDIVRRMWLAAQKPEFSTTRYELAVAISRSSTRIERACQEVLHWAQQHPDGTTFETNINRTGFASPAMRDFVAVFRANLADAGAPTAVDTIWRLLRRFNILVFDFETPGSDSEHRARERGRSALVPHQAARATELWPILAATALDLARAGGNIDRPELLRRLQEPYGLRFGAPADLRTVHAKLTGAAHDALDDIKDQVGGVRLARSQAIERGEILLDDHRMLEIVGEPGVGKSAVLKHLAQRLAPEGAIIIIAPGRIVPGGWIAMANALGCPASVTREELLNELGCGGGATLFIDNIDQIEDEGERATIKDLLRGVLASPGWRAVVTSRDDNDAWKAKLPQDLVAAGLAPLHIEEINDAETAVLAAGNPALSALLDSTHPARAIARNLFHLSQLIEVTASQPQSAIPLASETDLALAWWRYGGGRDDTGRLARLKILRTLGSQVLSRPGQAAFRADEFEASIVTELLRLQSLREVRQGSTITFRHDVQRDWTIGMLLDEEPNRLKALALDQPMPGALSRGMEIAAKLALDADPTGTQWLALLAAVEQDGCHWSWRRPVLLALPRSERAVELLQRLEPALLQDKGRRLREILRLVMAVDSEPLAKVIARTRPNLTLPKGADAVVIPKGTSWAWLAIWIIARADALPSALIPDIAKFLQCWLMANQAHASPINALIIGLLFQWLTRIEAAMHPVIIRDMREAEAHDLDFPHVRDVRDDIRTTCFALAHHEPAAAQRYLQGLDADKVRHDEAQFILRGPGSLPRAAPAAFVDFALAALIEKDDPDDPYGRRHDVLGPFGVHDGLYSPAAPGQGPFFDLLEHAPAEGLRLMRAVVEHATEWRRLQYAKARRTVPTMTIPFPEGPKTFAGDFGTYYWGRSSVPSATAGSALMALEAWGHRQIETGRAFGEVLHDVLGPSGSSVAFVSVAADLALSHWGVSRDHVWPLLATPELQQWDSSRYVRDITGVDRMLGLQRDPVSARVKQSDLDARVSRRTQLADCIGDFTHHGPPETLAGLRAALQQARDRIAQASDDDDDPINGLLAIAERALRMTDAQHWQLRKVQRADGTEVEGWQFQMAPDEAAHRAAAQQRSAASAQHFNIRVQLQAALLEPSKSTPETDRRAIVMAATLAARNYEGDDRSGVEQWARDILHGAAADDDQTYRGNDQIVYSAAALASLGLIALYRRQQTQAGRDVLLDLAAHPHPAVLNALGTHLTDLQALDDKLPRALIRIIMASAIYPHRSYEGDEDQRNETASKARIAAAIAAERTWVHEDGEEPTWPDLPLWHTRPRRGVRIGAWNDARDVSDDEPAPELLANENRLGTLVDHLIPLTLAEPPPWVVGLASHLMAWTDQANGPPGDDDRDRDHRPTTWNTHFFDFVGILCVALPHQQVEQDFLVPIATFTEEALHDAAATFLRGFDRATLAPNAGTPENPAAVRTFLADRVRRSRSFRRLRQEKSIMAETHLGDAICALFYQPSRWAHQGKANIPQGWGGLLETMPTLTELVKDAPASGYVTTAFLTLIEASPRAALLPSVVAAMSAWCSAYGSDANFWSEKAMGTRVCAWLDSTLQQDTAATLAAVSFVRQELTRCLDVLTRAGVAQARELEDRLAVATPQQDTA